ncbi:TRAP-type C4-dicarboxylate transport system permease small subunit [Halomonas organivorans]|uniref:TRAP transporter small permease protein n=2 Tax=Halomonas organivorans TaxID=257772 RepID=A0A7W5G599_9GAMM|nr:TRAP-type C4-dicarboxylate transport system permease small subunit [Halomonas organivorans]
MTYRLRPLYILGGYLSATCLVLICALITAQIIGRIVDLVATALGGERIGLAIPGLAEISGFLLVGATFLGLAYTFIHGAHIRVTLLIGRLPARRRVYVEAACLSVALALCLYLTFYTYRLLADSIAFGETSYGLLSIPLWLPQSAMLGGIVLLCLALGEAWWQALAAAARHPEAFTLDDGSPE